MKEHIEAMKFREQEARRVSDDARLKADVIMKERMELELFLDKADEARRKQDRMLESLSHT